MANPVVTYAYINANLRARISKLLPAQALQALAEAASLQETLSLLRDTPYGFIEDIYNRTGDLKLAERDLFKLEIGLYSNVLRHLSGPAAEFTGKLILRFEIENIKNALRVFFDRVVRGRSVEADVHYILYDDILSGVQPDRIVNAESVEQVIAALEPTVYGPVLKQHLAEIPARGTLFRTEAALDRFFYEQVLDSSGKLTPRDRQIAQRLLSLEIDLQNISWVMRLQTFYSLSSGEIGEYLVPHGASFEPQWMKQGGETPASGRNSNRGLKGLCPCSIPCRRTRPRGSRSSNRSSNRFCTTRYRRSLPPIRLQ
jgi:V/A-type H+-transporting ATPase subunit C